MFRPSRIALAVTTVLLLSLDAARSSVLITRPPERSDVKRIIRSVLDLESAKYNCSIAASVMGNNLGTTAVSVAAGRISGASNAPMTLLNDTFVWGSITKVSTGTAIMRLVERSELSLDEPMER